MRRAELLVLLAGAGAVLAFAPRARASVAPAPVSSSSARWTPPASAAPYLPAIADASAAYGLPDGLLARLIYEESHFRPDIIAGDLVSSAGAIGIAQFEPDTAAELGVDPYDALSSIDGAARYLAELRARFGSWRAALAAYNWGQGNLARKGLDAAPPATRHYIAAILADTPEAT